MTLEELFESSADELDKLSDEELRKYFEPYFQVTRPEMARKVAESNGQSTTRSAGQSAPPQKQLTAQQKEVLSRLAAQGVDISFASHKFRKK